MFGFFLIPWILAVMVVIRISAPIIYIDI